MDNKRKSAVLSHILYSSPMIIIMVLTLLLLTYVGFGEARRKYTEFELSKMITQVDIVKNALDIYLKAGLPIEQFSGFGTTSEMLLRSDNSIQEIRITDSSSKLVFKKNRGTETGLEDSRRLEKYKEVKIQGRMSELIHIEESKDSFQVTQTLRNKFGVAGYASIKTPKGELLAFLTDSYYAVFFSCIALSLFFLIFVVVFEYFMPSKKNRQKYYQGIYILSFLILSIIIAQAVFKIYEHGAKSSTKALSDSMTQRLSAIVELKIDIGDIKGIGEAFSQYQESNPEINAIAITENNVTISHTDPTKIGVVYQKPDESLEYVNILKQDGSTVSKEIRVAVSLPTHIITDAILSSSKTFLVLLIACVLFSLIFLNAGNAILEVIAKETYEMDSEKSLKVVLDEIAADGIVTKDEKARLELKLADSKELHNDNQLYLDNFYSRIKKGELIEKDHLDTGTSDTNKLDPNNSLKEILDEIAEDGIVTNVEKKQLELKLEEERESNEKDRLLLDAFYKRIESGELVERDRLDIKFEVGLNLIQPAYFLIVFVNALSISFLPQLVQDFATKSNSSLASGSLPFTIYYLMFALVLIPAGHFAEKGDLKKLMAAGFLAEVVGLTLVAISDNYWILTLGRSASGIGQGFFLIGLQSYVLAITPPSKKSAGHAVKVIGRNSGLIAGTAIGALLYAFVDYKFIFISASIISIAALIYLIILVPRVRDVSGVYSENVFVDRRAKKRNTFSSMFRNIAVVLKDMEFIKTLLTIGIIGKMSIAGVVMFAVPLLLTQKGFATEDIGLALMLYYIFGMGTTKFATKIVDAPGATRWVLSANALIGGGASLFLGFVGIHQVLDMASTPGITWLSYLAVGFNDLLAGMGFVDIDSILIIFFIILMGVSNGLLAAPIMTHVGNSTIARKNGVKSVSATYVFLERFGHVTGPFIIGSLIVANQNSSLAVSLFGLVTITLGVVFLLTARTPKFEDE
ncbi:MAG: MFS transporter [Proteobacteria bacterium]|nr:MFS transporter [Pseudomonadota bacterium]